MRSLKTRVDCLVEATGGRAFYAKEYPNLDEVYDEVEIELRSQYVPQRRIDRQIAIAHPAAED